MDTTPLILAAIHIGPVQFDRPVWLWLLPPLALLTLWMARSSLSGLGATTRRVALAARLLVIAMIVAALAQPSWRREAENVAVTVIVDQSKSVPLQLQSRVEDYIKGAAAAARPGDDLGRVTVARDAYVQALPGPPADRPDTQQVINRDGTNLEEAMRLAMAVAPQQKANRIVLATDGNETEGSILAIAEAARAAGIRVDVLPLKYAYDNEVIVDRLIAPATARMGETVNLRVLISATAPTTGRLSILVNGDPLDLDPDSDALGQLVELEAGMNPLVVPVPLPRAGAQEFSAVFEPLPGPDGALGDSMPENNRALAVTFVSGEGKVLLLTESTEDAAALVDVLTTARIAVDVRAPSEGFASLVELGVYDAVMLVNVAAYRFSLQQQEDLRTYVHDMGGGLIMIGGPDSFGAGGWIGSPVADALPVKLDPPQKRQMPRGALALIMHSCEMPQGNYWGQKTAEAAVANLSRQDLVGIIEYSWQAGGEAWVLPMSEVGSGAAAKRAIANLTFGDAPSFDSMMRMAIKELEDANAGQKHCIIISDGDPTPPAQDVIARFQRAGVSVSTVMVFPHMGTTGGEWQTMKNIADATGGTAYAVTQNNQLSRLPEIFIKEAQTVRRALIWEGDPFVPAPSGLADAMRRIPTPVPPIRGYVVTAEREGLSQVSLRAPTADADPILASWQYGLGRAIAFTSDASTRWAGSWIAWGSFRQFWEQHVRWAMRPGGSADIRVLTDDQGDRTKVTVEALDQNGDRLNFVRFRGRVIGPSGKAEGVELRQVGPGLYEGWIDSSDPGAYVMNFRYDTPAPEGGSAQEGNVQAAVTRPFADEFRALHDNSALLTQVANLTGGRILPADPAQANLWDREGLAMPVALRPIWLWVAMAGIGLFLADVAVRRVRIDLYAIARAARRGLERRRTQAGQQMGSLLEARERAQQAMAQRGGGADANGPAAPPPPSAPAAPATSSIKFEASAEELAAARQGGPVGAADLDNPDAAPSGRAGDGQKKPDAAGSKDENLSRLLKAKRRARDEMEGE